VEESTLVLICILLYLASWIAYLAYAVFQSRGAAKTGDWLVLAGVTLHTFIIGFRWVKSYQIGIGHAPFSNLYESMVFFSWTMGAVYLVSLWKWESRMLGVLVMPLVYLSLASASLMNPEVESRVPALQSNWLTAHVIRCFTGYAAFAVAFCSNILYLVKVGSNDKGTGGLGRNLPEADILDEFSYRIIGMGFSML
jgi:ABC-type transport system involved in cytochrome c biogenesis permease subunit